LQKGKAVDKIERFPHQEIWVENIINNLHSGQQGGFKIFMVTRSYHTTRQRHTSKTSNTFLTANLPRWKHLQVLFATNPNESMSIYIWIWWWN
jgi:hypothetical protein